MILTPNQKEYLEPMMIEYEKYLKDRTISFNHFERVVKVYKEHGASIRYCNSCGDDKLMYVKEMYRLWK